MNKMNAFPQQYSLADPLRSSTASYGLAQNINDQIQALDRQNRKLIAIAQNIMKTSFIRQAEQTPAVILQLEQDMKMSFNSLIQSIRDFFMSIDSKLKEIGVAVQAKMGESQLERSKHTSRGGNDKIEMLTMRMACMEQNIKKSQQNEAKLISIIEEMHCNQKRFSSQEQPTIRKDGDYKNYSNSNSHQNSFRLFSMNNVPHVPDNNLFKKPQSQQTYKKFQQYSNSPVVDSLGPFPQKQQEFTPFLCGVGSPINKIEDNYSGKGIQQKKMNYLKNTPNQFQFESSNRIHRLSNLIKGLKE